MGVYLFVHACAHTGLKTLYNLNNTCITILLTCCPEAHYSEFAWGMENLVDSQPPSWCPGWSHPLSEWRFALRVAFDKHAVGASSRLAQPPLLASVLVSYLISSGKKKKSLLWNVIELTLRILNLRCLFASLSSGCFMVRFDANQFVQCFWDEVLPQCVLIILKSRPHDTHSIP